MVDILAVRKQVEKVLNYTPLVVLGSQNQWGARPPLPIRNKKFWLQFQFTNGSYLLEKALNFQNLALRSQVTKRIVFIVGEGSCRHDVIPLAWACHHMIWEVSTATKGVVVV